MNNTTEQSAPPATRTARPAAAGNGKGTRLPEGWMPDAATRAEVQAQCPDVDLAAEHRIFTDHWAAAPGAKGVKANWTATWRNWMRREQKAADEATAREQRHAARTVTRPSVTARKLDTAREAADQLRALREQRAAAVTDDGALFAPPAIAAGGHRA